MRRVSYSWMALVCCMGCTEAGPAPEARDVDEPDGTAALGNEPSENEPSENEPEPLDPGANYLLQSGTEAVSVTLAQPDLGAIGTRLASARAQTASSLAAAHAVPHVAELGYDPLEAGGLELIDQSELALVEAERSVLGERGFVIVPRHEYPSFPYGYAAIYAADLPVFISADMVLEAVHRSYDAILARLELTVLMPELAALLSGMRAALASGTVELATEVVRDADLFLTVAENLLRGVNGPALGPETAEAKSAIYSAALRASGEQVVELFGTQRRVDFSQFEPRGHYAGVEGLEHYFRTMIWLGRLDLRLIETLPDGAQVFRPRQLKAALALRALMNDELLASWRRIDATIGNFVGEHDYMTLPELDELLGAVGVTSAAALSSVPDARIAEAITAGQFGAQRIASQIIRKRPGATGTLPLDSSFAFMGQRYTVDSHVFSNVVYDRVGQGTVLRYVPSPLDAAFAALGNDQAVDLLSTELSAYPYAGELSAMRELTDAHPASYWQSSLYTSWLAALRSLSPSAVGTPLDDPGLPEIARTEGWGRRVLNTQLASWAQLRHDTLLYAKQSYTTGNLCEFPDAYVDPYPELFHAITRFAERGQASLSALDAKPETEAAAVAESIGAYFERLGNVSATLAEMAELQRTGEPHSAEHLAFINDAVVIQQGCGSPYQTGWYAQLFFDGNGLDLDPTIADVHTDPGGPDRPATVLHVATGMPRLMVMTRESCQGPRAYAGIVFAYHEQLPTGFTRINDQEWLAELAGGTRPGDVPWMASLLPAASD